MISLSRTLFHAIVVVGIVVALVLVGTAAGDGLPTTHKGLTAQQWHARYVREHRALTKHGVMVREEQATVRGLSRQLAKAYRAEWSEPIMAIVLVFRDRAAEAIRVADCETGGTFSVWSDNGQYENIFQMGTSERRTYGWHTKGDSALVAALAAHRYFVASGKDWSPWECKP